MDEVVRVLDALHKSAKHKVATPANWKPGDPVVISPSVSNEAAKQMFPQGYKSTHLPSNKDYLRFTHVWISTDHLTYATTTHYYSLSLSMLIRPA